MKNLIFLFFLISFNTVQAQDVTFKLINEQVTNAGASWEADVTIESVAGFKLGSGQLYFNYNTAAFGQNISDNSTLLITHPSGSILAKRVGSPPFEFDYYTQFIESDNTTSRFSYAWQHAFSGACLLADNVTATAAVLFHIRLDYTTGGGSQSSGVCFESTSLFDDQTFIACGPNDCNNVDCINFAGTQITNDFFDCNAILPIELSDFTAHLEDQKSILLKWETLSERNANYFNIQRKYGTSDDWEYIGKQNAKGNSQTLVKYEFKDITFKKNLMYYRLKMVDENGIFDYSKIKVVAVTGFSSAIQLYPNPSSDKISIKTTMFEGAVKLKVYDVIGKEIYSTNLIIRKNENTELDVSSWKEGCYFIEISSDKGAEVKKFLKVK